VAWWQPHELIGMNFLATPAKAAYCGSFEFHLASESESLLVRA
jgi:hypothetical protein